MSDKWIVSMNEWASAWAPAIWRASWQGGVFILVVWLICKVFRSMPAAAKSWLWWIASLQLLIRFAMVTSLDLPILPAQPSNTIAEFGLQAEPGRLARAVEIPFSTVEMQKAPIQEAPLYTASQTPMAQPMLPESPKDQLSSASFALGLWGLGILACLSVSIRRLLGARKMLLNAAPILTGPAFDLSQEFSIDCGIPMPRLLASEDALCPLLAGWYRPSIVLPTSSIHDLDEAEMRMAIAHEFAHLIRRDLWFGIVPGLTQCLYFFHPLAWLATHEVAAAREAACD